MTKGARTLAELDRAVSILRTRDSARARELKALRGDLDAIERALTDEREALLRALADQPLPAANSTPPSSHSWRSRAGAALSRARTFLAHLIQWQR
mgnify:CR=1 FL=1